MALFDTPANNSGVFNFGLDDIAKAYLIETARWTKFLAVVGFVVIALIGVVGIFSAFIIGSYSSRFGMGMQGLMIAVYGLIAVLYFFPTYYLFKFSTMIKRAIISADQDGFNGALRHLRNAFRFIGVLTLIMLCLYALIFIVGIAGASFGHYFG